MDPPVRPSLKHVNNLNLWRDKCFNGSPTSNVWWRNMSRSRESRPRGSRKLQTKITTLTRRHVYWYDAVQYARALITSCYGVGNQEAYSVNDLLNSRFTFRLWQILVFLLVMTIVITVTRILAARFCPASPCYKISGKEHGGNQWCIPSN